MCGQSISSGTDWFQHLQAFSLFCHKSILRIVLGHHILRILVNSVLMVVKIFSLKFIVILHVSTAYNTDFTLVLNIPMNVSQEQPLDVQISLINIHCNSVLVFQFYFIRLHISTLVYRLQFCQLYSSILLILITPTIAMELYARV